MGLVLRKNLTAPLTHTQLDGNFEFLQITEWKPQIYEKGKIVYIFNAVTNTTAVFMCLRTHNTTLYHNNEFRMTDDSGVIYWSALTNGQTGVSVKHIYLANDKITLRVVYHDDTFTDINLSELYSVGLTSHQFVKITQDDYNPEESGIALDYTGNLAMTDNIIVVELSTAGIDANYFITLPNGDAATSGARLRVFLKEFNALNPLNQFFINTYTDTDSNRILGKNLIMHVSNNGYYLPLKPLEVVELIWDGNDWLVLNYIKEEYVSSLTEAPTL